MNTENVTKTAVEDLGSAPEIRELIEHNIASGRAEGTTSEEAVKETEAKAEVEVTAVEEAA